MKARNNCDEGSSHLLRAFVSFVANRFLWLVPFAQWDISLLKWRKFLIAIAFFSQFFVFLYVVARFLLNLLAIKQLP